MPAARNCGGVVLPKGAGAPDLEAAAQRAMTERVAFAAQRGWYYEEWGSLLHQMTGFFAHPLSCHVGHERGWAKNPML